MKTFLKIFLGAFLAFIVFANPFKSCHPVQSDEGERYAPMKQMQVAPVLADSEIAEKVFYTGNSVKIPSALKVQNIQDFTEMPVQPDAPQITADTGNGQQRPPANSMEWILNGGLGAALLALLAFVVKSDRETLKKFSEAIDKLADNDGNIKELLTENRQANQRIENGIAQLLNK